ncbi:MAG TPA: glycosyltransferase family 2 protein [Stellaceae bacterium]|nr:glycosyltransferase family 2 protein [Stellaceae bacterium]
MPDDKVDRKPPDISLVIPVYKEEQNIGPCLARLVPVLERIGTYEILFCMDPSPDRTEEVIEQHIAANGNIGLMIFSRRVGQPAATMAGILNCSGETCVVIDVDLQDPPELITELYAKLKEGNDVVYAQRRSREGETWIKKTISSLGYKLINAIADCPIPPNTGDFRIMNRRVIEELRFLPESHGFLRGLVALVGFRQAAVLYDRDPRHSGVGNYNRNLGSLKIGLNGVIGFSTIPLSFLLWLGFSIAAVSTVLIVAMIVAKIILGDSYPLGIPTVTVLVLFLGGVQLVGIGILGEYLGRVYEEVRRRPRYIVDRIYNMDVLDDGRQRMATATRDKPNVTAIRRTGEGVSFPKPRRGQL